MDRRFSIAAVVVTFNRLPLLKECLSSLRKQSAQVDAIFVINNGCTDGTAEWLESQKDLTVINQENVGGAGGFSRGIKEAFEAGFDWIWIMDDDVEPGKIVQGKYAMLFTNTVLFTKFFSATDTFQRKRLPGDTVRDGISLTLLRLSVAVPSVFLPPVQAIVNRSRHFLSKDPCCTVKLLLKLDSR